MRYLLCDICDYTVEKFKASTLEKQSTVGSPSNEDHHLSEKKRKKGFAHYVGLVQMQSAIRFLVENVNVATAFS